MRVSLCRASLAIGLLLTAGTDHVSAALLDVNGSFSLVNQNFPSNVTVHPPSLPLDGTATEFATGTTIRVEVTPTGPNSEWVEFIFEKSSAPLANNANGLWRTDIFDIPITEPIIFDGFFFHWSIDGVLAEDITPIAGLPGVIPHPMNAGLGNVYGAFFPDPGTFDGPLNAFVQLGNYSTFIQQGGMNPDLLNGFTVGMHLTAVPEASSLVLFGIGTLGLMGYVSRRRKQS